MFNHFRAIDKFFKTTDKNMTGIVMKFLFNKCICCNSWMKVQGTHLVQFPRIRRFAEIEEVENCDWCRSRRAEGYVKVCWRCNDWHVCSCCNEIICNECEEDYTCQECGKTFCENCEEENFIMCDICDESDCCGKMYRIPCQEDDDHSLFACIECLNEMEIVRD